MSSPADEVVRATPLVRVIGAAVRASARVSAVTRRRDRVPPPRPGLTLTVASVTRPADGVVSLRLVAPDAGELPAWSPGAHLDLVLPSGRVRQYSLCGDPADRFGYRVAVRRLPEGTGSVEVHGLRSGDRVGVRGPRQGFPLLPASRYLFLAGGIGITPILPMVRAVAAAGAPWRLVYAGRDRASMPFLDELPGDGTVIRTDAERGGPPTGAELLGHAPGPGTAGYCCGPPPMLAAVRAALRGSDLSVLHAERFSPPPVLGGRPLTVSLARSGVELDVPADRSVLEVLRAARPGVAYSCRQGFCGTCRVRVLDGEVEHRDRALTPAERVDSMTVCVSRAVGHRLVLDL